MKLFLCSTPLQLKIAIRIIEEKSLQDVTLLFTGDLPNRRSDFYLEQMKNLVDQVFFFDKNKYLTKSNSRYLHRKAKETIARFNLDNVKEVYLANLNDRLYHHILSCLNCDSLITFDDGTENVNPLSKFYRNKRYNFIRKTIQRFYGRRYWIEEILQETKCHYTIYKELDNVVKGREYISLYKPILSRSCTQTINILVGSVYRDMVIHRSQGRDLIELLDIFIQRCKIDCYIPHPREEKQYFLTCETVIPEQMAEEFILDYISKGYQVNLYGFGGSTQLNLDAVPNIVNYLFECNLISDRVRYGYALFKGDTERISL